MTREIKFRAWHTKANKMFSAEEMAEDQLTLLPTGKFINVSSTSVRLSRIYDEMIPLQFTGLKDKNGKDIYDSDILGSSGRVIGHIEGGVRGYCYDIVYLNPTDDKRWSLYSCIGTDYRGDIEVIGNIYENPELLKL